MSENIKSVGWYFNSTDSDAVVLANKLGNEASSILLQSSDNNNYTTSQPSEQADYETAEGLVAFVVNAYEANYYKISSFDANGALLADSAPVLLDPERGRFQTDNFQVYHSDNIEWTGLEGASTYFILIEEENPGDEVVALLKVNGNHLWIYADDWGSITTEFLRKPLIAGRTYGVAVIALDGTGSPIGSTGSIHFEYGSP